MTLGPVGLSVGHPEPSQAIQGYTLVQGAYDRVNTKPFTLLWWDNSLTTSALEIIYYERRDKLEPNREWVQVTFD